MKTLTFVRGMMIVSKPGEMTRMERVGDTLSAEDVAKLMAEQFKDEDDNVQSDNQQ